METVARLDAGLSVESHDWTEWSQLAPQWSALAAACDHATFFSTAEWVETWLDVFGPLLQPAVLLFRGPGNDVVGACVLVRRNVRKGPFLIRRVYINTAGESDDDSPCIEFNELLCKPGHEHGMAVALKSFLDGGPSWDELSAPGMLGGASLQGLQEAFTGLHIDDMEKHSYFVALDEVRRSGKSFVDTLASRERTRYRQNIRKYSEIGDLVLDEASTVEQALAYLDALAILHQQTWTSRGQPGSFASATFYDFHRRLIARCFPLGGIQLVHLRAGESTIGYHYNFVHNRRSYFYQCGYDYSLGEKTSPGVIVHASTIEQCLQKDLACYEFMAGDIEYKRRLGTGSRPMHWITWQASTMKMRGYEVARHAKRAVRERSLELRSMMAGSLRGLVSPLRGNG